MWWERIEFDSGTEEQPMVSTATHVVGAATGEIAAAGRATECEAMQREQCCSDGSPLGWKCVFSAKQAVVNRARLSTTSQTLCC